MYFSGSTGARIFLHSCLDPDAAQKFNIPTLKIRCLLETLILISQFTLDTSDIL